MAMKVKVKLDVASIKKWLFEHGEKAVFGCMMLVFLGFTYSAIQREVLDDSKQPEKLRQKATEVKGHVENSKWDEQRENVHVVNFDQRAKRDQLAANTYALTVPLNTPIADPKGKRDDPKLLKMEDLQVSAGFGTFAYRGEDAKPAAAPAAATNTPAPAKGGGLRALRDAGAAGKGAPVASASGSASSSGNFGIRPSSSAKLKAQPWAVITGLIPLEKQKQEYARVFERTAGGSAERDTPRYAGVRVLRAEVNDAEPDKLDWKPIPRSESFEAQWESQAGEIIAPEFIDPTLTSHLGPLVGAKWGESVSHPKIRLTGSEAAPTAPVAAADSDAGGTKPDAAPADDGFSSAGPAPVVTTAPTTPTTAAPPAPIEYRLLRVFDYSVEPNKRYRYRLQVRIENPNYQLAPRYLKNAESQKEQYRIIECDPTDVVSIPNGNGVLAGSVIPQRPEPMAKLMLIAIDKEKGIEATTEVSLTRGTVANHTGKANARDPRTEQAMDLDEVEFRTGMVVLDMYGGKPLSRRQTLTSPAEVLLLDASGHLTVHSELADQTIYQRHKPAEEPSTRKDKDKDKEKDTIPGGQEAPKRNLRSLAKPK